MVSVCGNDSLGVWGNKDAKSGRLNETIEKKKKKKGRKEMFQGGYVTSGIKNMHEVSVLVTFSAACLFKPEPIVNASSPSFHV